MQIYVYPKGFNGWAIGMPAPIYKYVRRLVETQTDIVVA